MAEEVTIDITVNDSASAELKTIKAQLAGMTKAQGKANATTRKGGKANEMLSRGLGLVKAGAIGVAVELVAVAAKIGLVVSAANKMLGAFREQDDVNRSLEDSLARAGLAGDELIARYEELQARASEVSEATGIGDEAILRGMSRFVQVTGQATVSQKDLSIVLGIARKEGKGAADAASIYGRALKGEIGPLKDITSLTKEQEEALNKMTDTEERAAKVTEILGAQFAGQAENISPTFLAMDRLTNAHGDLIQKMGELIEESGIVPIILQPITDTLRLMESALEDNQDAITRWAYDTLEGALENLGAMALWVKRNREELAGLVTVGRLVVKGLGILVSTSELVFNAMKALAGMVATGLIQQFRNFLSIGKQTAEFLDLEIAESLGKVDDAARDLQDTTAGLTFDAVREGGKSIDDMVAQFDELPGIIMDNDKVARGFGDAADYMGRKVGEAQKRLETLRKTAKKSRDEGVGTGPRGPDTPPGGVGDPKAAEKAQRVLDAEADRLQKIREQQQAAASRQRLAAQELEVVHATTAQEKARKEFALEMMRIREQGLIGAEQELAVAQARNELASTLRDIEETQREEARAMLDEQIASQRAFSDQVMSNISALAAQGDAMSSLIGLTQQLAAVQQQYNAGVVDGAQATQQALSATGAAASTFASAIGASAQVQAGILAVFEAANSVAAFAQGRYLKGAQHAAAATLYSVAAAKPNPEGKAGGGGGGRGVPSSASAASGGSSRSRQRESQDNLTEAIAEAFGGGAGTTIIYDFRGSTNLSDNPTVVRKLATMVEGDQRLRGLDPDQMRPGRRGR